jgi:DNA-binding CsgD family transcriptional regulator
MEQGSELDEVVARLYEAGAGLADVRWAQALAGVQRLLQAHTVVLLAMDVSLRTLLFHSEAGDAPPEALLDYTRSYHMIDPRLARLRSMAAGRWAHCHEVFDDAFVAADPFYQEFLLPYGGRWSSGIKLMEEGGVAVIFAVTRRLDQGPLVGDAFVLCERLAWHVTKAYRLNQLRALPDDGPGVVSAALHQLSVPVFLLDGECQVRFSNRSAGSLLSAGGALYALDGRLALRHADNDRAFRAVAKSLYGKAGDDRFPASAYLPLAMSGHEGVAQPERSRVLGMMLSSLLPERTIGAFGGNPALLAVAYEQRGLSEPDPAVVASAFGLTRAEARIAIAFALGLSVEQIAERRCKAVSTIRSQVKSMLAKMGCTRQSEVVSRVLSLPFIFLGMRCSRGEALGPSRLAREAGIHIDIGAVAGWQGQGRGATRVRKAPGDNA